MEPMRSIFIPKHPLPPTMEVLPRLLILDCRFRKSRKNCGTAAFLPDNSLVVLRPAAGPRTSDEEEKWWGWGLAEPSAVSSVLAGAKIREDRCEPKRESNTWKETKPKSKPKCRRPLHFNSRALCSTVLFCDKKNSIATLKCATTMH